MDLGDVVTAIIFLLWLLSRLKGLVTRKGEAAPPERQPAAPAGGAQLSSDLAALPARTQTIAVGLDPTERALYLSTLGDDLFARAAMLAAELERPEAMLDPHAMLVTAGEARELLTHHAQVSGAAEQLSGRRGASELTPIADGLLEDLSARTVDDLEARGLRLLPTPVVAVAVPGTPPELLRRGPLAVGVVPVAASAATEPWQWAGLASGFARYLVETIPGLEAEVYDRLELDTGDAPIAPGSEAMSRLFFASWLRALLTDVVGAQLIGPAYLRAVVAARSQPDPASRSHVIVVRNDGTVAPQPPTHVRVHTIERWLAVQGLDARAAIAAWDERTGHSQSLRMVGAISGEVPFEPIRDHFGALLARLDDTPLATLGGRRLAEVDGLEPWRPLASRAARARDELARGRSADAGARVLLPAAIDASLDDRRRARIVARGLASSLGAEAEPVDVAELVAESRPTSAPPVRATAAAPPGVARPQAVVASRPLAARAHRTERSIDRRRLVEALILGDAVLARRSGSTR